MTWTYGGDPSESDQDKVRFLVGDTDTADQQIADEEIAWLLTEEPGAYHAAAAAARAIAAKYARQVDKAVGDLRLSASQRAAHYQALAATLTRRAQIAGAVPFAGGISASDKQAQDDDIDRVRPAFSRDMQSVPGNEPADLDQLGES
jgi:hypothetical protein